MGDPWVPMSHAAFPSFLDESTVVIGSAAFLQLQGLLVRAYWSTAYRVHSVSVRQIPSVAPGE